VTVGGLPGISSATTSASQQWVRRYNGPANDADFPSALGMSPDGSELFVTGRSRAATSGFDYATAAYDAATGAPLWSERYDGPRSAGDWASALGVSPDGSELFVTGVSSDPSSHMDYATLAYDSSTGALLWTKRYNGPGNGFDAASAIGVSPDGSTVFVTGLSAGSTRVDDHDYATVAYDAVTGARLWAERYDGPGNDADDADANALGVSPDGSQVFVTGGILGSRGNFNYATVSYDTATGVRLWAVRYNGPSNGFDVPTTLGVSPDGSQVFVTGDSVGTTGDDDYATVAYDTTTGAESWVARYDNDGPGPAGDSAAALGVSPDGSEVYVTGTSVVSKRDSDYATVAYDATTGARLWVARYDGPGYNGSDAAHALGVSPDGSEVYVTGQSVGSTGDGDFDYATVAYGASTGAELWNVRYNGPADDLASADALVVGLDGSQVFVTGYSRGSTTDIDYTTVAYGLA
jgi:hypothetical protein